MAVEAHWDNEEKTIIRYEIYGQWTITELWNAYDASRAMMEFVNHQVNFIVVAMDAQSMNHIPNGFITQMGSIFRNAHPHAGHTIVVRPANTMLTQIYERIIAKALPHVIPKFGFATSLEEARAKHAERTNAEQRL